MFYVPLFFLDIGMVLVVLHVDEVVILMFDLVGGSSGAVNGMSVLTRSSPTSGTSSSSVPFVVFVSRSVCTEARYFCSK